MPISLDSAQELFRTGSFVDLVEQAPAPSDLRAAQPELRLLVAHALFHTANTAAAERIAQEENIGGTAPPAIRAHCEQILGLLRRFPPTTPLVIGAIGPRTEDELVGDSLARLG
jgi:hypothetical protein